MDFSTSLAALSESDHHDRNNMITAQDITVIDLFP